MAHTPTPNYGLAKPVETDNMSAFDVYINPNWDKLTDAAAPPNGTVLPTSGTYNLGDRFYKTDEKSIYILTVKDADWGWFWRPVQSAISPWVTVPTTCMNVSGWTLNPVPAKPFQIALDNRGKCYWRGIVGPTTGNITRNSSVVLFKVLPTGIRPRQRGAFMLGHETLAVSTDGTQLTSYQGARIFIQDDGINGNSVRAFGGTADFNLIHLGGIHYAVGTAKYTTP